MESLVPAVGNSFSEDIAALQVPTGWRTVASFSVVTQIRFGSSGVRFQSREKFFLSPERANNPRVHTEFSYPFDA